MIDRPTQQQQSADHLAAQRATNRLAAELRAARVVATAARCFHRAASAWSASFGEYEQTREQLADALDAYDKAVAHDPS